MTKVLEVFVMANAAGDYECGPDEDACCEAFEENIGGSPRRLVRLLVKLDLPAAVTAAVEVPAEAGEVTVAAE